MDKRLTEQQIKATADEHDIDYAMLRAILEVECKGSGFLADGTPTILFERHIFWRELGKAHFYSIRRKMGLRRPDLCSKYPTKPGEYGAASEQPERLATIKDLVYEILPSCDESTLLQINDCALKATSWGLGQIMGFNHRAAGFDSVGDFVDAMYDSEQAQLDAVVNVLHSWGLTKAMRHKDFRTIAKTWNGRSYWKHGYHKKLERSYLTFQNAAEVVV